MTYPPQQPEDGWSDPQSQQPVDPFATGGGGQAQPPQQGYGQPPQQDPYGRPDPYAQQQPYGAPAYPQHEEPPTDQTQSLPPRQPHDEQGTQVISYEEQGTQVLGRPQPAAEQQQQPTYGQPIYQPQQPDGYGPPQQPQYPQQQPVQPYGQQANPYESPPAAAPVSADPQPYSAQPASGQPYSPRPTSSQPYAVQPTTGQPYSAQPTSGQPYQPTPPGVPESPFMAGGNLPSPVSAAPQQQQQSWGAPAATPQFTPNKRRGLPGWAYVVGVVVVVAALAVGAVFYFGIGDQTGDTTADGDSETSYEPVPITDPKSGFTFMSLPKPWQSLTELEGFESLPGFTSVVGQAYITESGGKPGTGWMGVLAVGELDAEAFKYKTGDQLDSPLKAFADAIDTGNWKDPTDTSRTTDLDGLQRDADPDTDYLRVDGRRGLTETYHMSWTSTSIEETGSTVMIGVFDMGDGRLAGYFVDLPDSLAEEQTEAIEQTILTLNFE